MLREAVKVRMKQPKMGQRQAVQEVLQEKRTSHDNPNMTHDLPSNERKAEKEEIGHVG